MSNQMLDESEVRMKRVRDVVDQYRSDCTGWPCEVNVNMAKKIVDQEILISTLRTTLKMRMTLNG